MGTQRHRGESRLSLTTAESCTRYNSPSPPASGGLLGRSGCGEKHHSADAGAKRRSTACAARRAPSGRPEGRAIGTFRRDIRWYFGMPSAR